MLSCLYHETKQDPILPLPITCGEASMNFFASNHCIVIQHTEPKMSDFVLKLIL